jgi:hypothetical protein
MPAVPLPDDAGSLKRKAAEAWRKARLHSALPGPAIDRLWSDTLMLAHRAPDRAQQVMFKETLWLFQLLTARTKWLHPPPQPEPPPPLRARLRTGMRARWDR